MKKGRLSVREEEILGKVTSEKFTSKDVGAVGSELSRLEGRGIIRKCGMCGSHNRTTLWTLV